MNYHMTTRRFIIFAALIAMTSCTEKEIDRKDVAETQSATEEEGYLPGVAVVQFNDELASLVEEDPGQREISDAVYGPEPGT
jgi:hypothetical protein